MDASRETMTSKLIANAKPSHEGLSFIRTPVDEFQLKGPEGIHFCLVYKPMRETLFQLQHRLKRQRLALPLFKFFIYCFLEALDYLHTVCRLIHTGMALQHLYELDANCSLTDIKDDNIMVTIENDAVLADFVNFHKRNPQPRHVRTKDSREIYLSQGDFGPLRGPRLLPELADFDLAFPRLDGDLGHLSAIQSHRFRAPEVLLGCPWSSSVDIWNLGLLVSRIFLSCIRPPSLTILISPDVEFSRRC